MHMHFGWVTRFNLDGIEPWMLLLQAGEILKSQLNPSCFTKIILKKQL